MEKQTVKLMFVLLRSAVFDNNLTDGEREMYSEEKLPELLALCKKHDLSHLLAYGLKKNGLSAGGGDGADQAIFKAAYRYERLKYDYDQLCAVLEAEKIPFIPLKGSVLRDLYPEPWMRTSCDIDILVHEEDSERAMSVLVNEIGYTYHGKTSHDMSLFAPSQTHVELHYHLVEDGIAQESSAVLKHVWDTAVVRPGFAYWYEMPDDMYYFYHIAHMAKHFEKGGCGIRPFIDLRILDHMEDADHEKRNELLKQGGLLIFAEASQTLSKVWFGHTEMDPISQQMEHYILHGGVYGSNENRIMVEQQKQGGRFKYVLSRIFIPYEVIQFYYPILQKHRWLTPFMEVRRWCKLIFCGDAKRIVKYSQNISADQADETKAFLSSIGL